MADSIQDTDQAVEVGINTTINTQSILLKRNPHLRENSQTSSPAGFGGLGARQNVRKQLMTPGSATSASSFEEGASYDGFFDTGTPASDRGSMTKSTRTEKMPRLTKQPTKKLSSPSRESLMRRLVNDEENSCRVDGEGDDFLPSAILDNLVVKHVPTIYAEGEAKALSTSILSSTSPSAKLTRRIVVPPRKNMRRVVVRSTGADGQTHEQVRYMDADGQVVQQSGNAAEDVTDETSAISVGRSTITGYASTPAMTLRRVVVRKTGADGQVHEEVQFVDAHGNVVDGEGVALNVTTSTMTPTPVTTQQIVTPRKLTQRTLRRTGADGQVHVQVQYLDVDGNIVRTEGEDFDSISGSSAVTRRIDTPGKTTRRVVVRRTGADGQVHEEVQYMDADGNVAQRNGTALATTSGSATSVFSSGRTTITRRIVSPGQTYASIDSDMLPPFRLDGTSVSVEQHIGGDGQTFEDEGRSFSSVGSFSGSVSSVTSDTSTTTSSRRIVTRRLMTSPNTVPAVHRSLVHKAGSSSDAEYEEDVQYVESKDGDLTTKVVTSQNGPGRRVTTRRVVTPQRVVRRMVIRKGTVGSGTEAVNGSVIDAGSAQNEDNTSSDESLGGSSSGRYSVSGRTVIPSKTRPVVSRIASPSDKSQKNLDEITVTDASLSEKFETTTSLSDEENASFFRSRDGSTCTSAASKRADVDSTKVDGDSQETLKARVVATVAGAAVTASAVDGDSNSFQNEIEGVLAVDERATAVTNDIAEAEKDEEPYVVGVCWKIFGKTETKTACLEASCSDDKEPTTLKMDVAPHNEKLVDMPEAAKADALNVVADFNRQSEPKHSSYQNSDTVAENPRVSDVPKTSDVIADECVVPSIMAPMEESSQGRSDSTVDALVSQYSGVRPSFAAREAPQKLPTREEIENELTAALYEISTLDEDKAPVSPAENVSVEVPGPHAATKSLVVSPVSPRENDFVQFSAVIGAAGVASVVENDPKEPEPYSFTDLAKTAATLQGPHAAVATTDEDVSNMPDRKTKRSFWKLWAPNKSEAFRTEDEKLRDMGEREESCVAAGAEMDDKIGSPVIHDQGAVVASPLADIARLAHTIVEVEEGLEPGHLDYNTAASAFDITTADDSIVSSESQQFEERKNSGREELMEVKPERAGGLWGFFGKKSKSAAVMTSLSSSTKVSRAIEGEDDKMTPDITTHNNEIAAVDQVEPIRHCIQSDSILTNAAAPVASCGRTVRDSERRTTELIDSIEPDIELDDHYVSIASPRRSSPPDDYEVWTVKPCSLAWSNLCLNRKSWKTFLAGTAFSGSDEFVLKDVSGTVKAGEFLVITGPSRDESLALMSCLAGFEDAMEGNVTVNGHEWSEKMNHHIGYVMHEDLFYETLTVQEHLIAQARLRMRRTHTDEMCLKRVEHVIVEMCLSGCRDKLIGGGLLVRGITRSERKLLALATALLTNPSILFVEEPTDNLDTFGAEKLVAKLRWLAFEKGLTVIVTLHHPSSHFYRLFDVLYLVADASCVYDGKAADCIAYFSAIGYQCPEYMSPIDYFMLQMVVGDRESDNEGVARVDALKREWNQRKAAIYAGNPAHVAAMSEDVVVDEHDQKNCYNRMGCCGQLWLLWDRHIRRLSRYGFVFQWHLLAALLIGVVFGLVNLQIDLKDEHGIQNFAGAFFYLVVVQMLFAAYRTFVFMPRETAIALRERQESRSYAYSMTLLCWYLTKIVAELPALIILSIVLFVPVFLLVGIGYGFEVYVYMQIVMVLAGWTAVGLAFATLGVLRHVTLALFVYTILLMLFGVFGGLLINVTDIPDWFVWLHYISPIKYSYESMMKIFWKRVDNIDCDRTLKGCIAFTGDGVLEFYSMEKRSVLSDSLILLVICLSLFFVAFWFLLALANKRISGLQWRYDWDFKGPLGHRQQRIASSIKRKAATKSSMHHIIDQKSQHNSSAVVERSIVVETGNHYIFVETPRAGGRGICDAPSMTLGWSSLWLKAPIDKKPKSNSEMQHLLCDASGSATCGELVLITGLSDDSNVALLESLGGLRKTMDGKVTLNGVVSAALKLSNHVAYVARDDLFYETLTVEEHLRFQAQLVAVNSSNEGCGLWCGADTSDVEAERVEQVLDELELSSKRHILIRYLSKADTKLLAVATALLDNPSVLLADEPTCGMDFYASQRVVLKLRQLARRGRTVVVTMTHPSSHLYALFDTLHLLAGGAAVYHGKVREAVSYFSSLGYQCPQYMSPVDYFVRQISARKNDNETGDVQAALFKEAWSARYSELCLADNMDEPESQDGEVFGRLRVGWCDQLLLLFRRHILRLARYRAVFGWHSFWMIVASVIFGLIFLQLDLDDQQDIQNWAGAFFFMIILQMLVMAYRTFVFRPREMAIVEREHRTGSYYLVSWYLTKVLTELPAMLVLSVLLFVPAYLLIGIGHGFKLYISMQFVMWLVGWSAIGLASLLLDVFHHVRVALIVYVLILSFFVICGGLLLNVDDVPNYFIWLHYMSPVKYGYEALMKLFWGRIGFLACGGSDGSRSENDGVMLDTVGDNSYGSSSSKDDDGCIAHSGDEVLTYYSMDMTHSSRSDSFILLELTLLYFSIGCAILSLRWYRNKRH
ncbi:hypothetical protein KXD40_008725 [Peronospora effusa]|uniref:ABC transporter domain-containing protein n=1 Tax=Peronospora effusa TaxID=542832 RepID=A0A3M6VS94_9STRA|nr:hypothetical protein DD238_006332 [Peronospora effusa]UIZ21815.1 hypothetical protein KXD40_008720 [Peronospora effusa]UIZ21912.1 hypothetical protein KXD40_008725 [Peronospora effusa]CAI5705212.1 unnamed protein product [Peronospora effusa]